MVDLPNKWIVLCQCVFAAMMLSGVDVSVFIYKLTICKMLYRTPVGCDTTRHGFNSDYGSRGQTYHIIIKLE